MDVNNIKVVSVNFTNRSACPCLQVMNINDKVITTQNYFIVKEDEHHHKAF